MQDLPPSRPLGACPVIQGGQAGWLFRVTAPHASAVSVVGEFNQWDPLRSPMTLRQGVWQCFIPGLREYDTYKFAIHTPSGDILYRADPYAYHSETPPGECSKLFDLSHYSWQDQTWFAYCARRPRQQPLHLYEVHLGSWRRTGEGAFLSYTALARYLIPYVKSMGFTGVALMPLMEHPTDRDLGYTPDSWFCPTSRFGTPTDFMHLVDELHCAGISVVMDFPTGCFSGSVYGLSKFDGETLFEAGEGSRQLNYSSAHVRQFLLDAAHFWLTEYHLDGLRVSHNFPDSPAERRFLRELARLTQGLSPARLLLADGRLTGRELVTQERWLARLMDAIPASGTIGSCPSSVIRPAPKGSLLALDHHLLAHRGGALTAAMTGDLGAKLSRARLLHLLLLSYPGKKMTFMGSELGQDRPWNPDYSLDWHLLHYEPYACQQAFFRAANLLYLTCRPLWACDNPADSFSLLLRPFRGRANLLVLSRQAEGETVYAIFNFSDAAVRHLRIGVNRPGFYRVLINSDGCCYGGQGRGSYGCWSSEDVPADGFPCSMQLEVPPIGGVLLAFDAPPPPVPVLVSPC